MVIPASPFDGPFEEWCLLRDSGPAVARSAPRLLHASRGISRRARTVAGRKPKGFTLIELLIVVAIIGIIAAIAIPNLLNAIDRGKQKRTMADIRSIGTAVEAYSVDNNIYPTAANSTALATVIEPIYIKKMPATDGWNSALVYQPVRDRRRRLHDQLATARERRPRARPPAARPPTSRRTSSSSTASSPSGPRACSSNPAPASPGRPAGGSPGGPARFVSAILRRPPDPCSHPIVGISKA